MFEAERFSLHFTYFYLFSVLAPRPLESNLAERTRGARHAATRIPLRTTRL